MIIMKNIPLIFLVSIFTYHCKSRIMLVKRFGYDHPFILLAHSSFILIYQCGYVFPDKRKFSGIDPIFLKYISANATASA